MQTNYPFPSIKELAREFGFRWPAFDLAVKETLKAETTLISALTDNPIGGRSLGVDCSLVLCGSFARYEMCKGSDYDWFLLIDGIANSEHAEIARRVGQALQAKGLSPPSSTGAFGNLIFSHDLVHRIGGGADSNANLTRRMLILLESKPIEAFSAGASQILWSNVVSNILNRYFEEDVHFSSRGKRQVPRFLLNDLTRYWRTICVDYAAKHMEQGEAKWAERNAKLRLSRKLIYSAGLAFCFSCQLSPPLPESDLFSGGVHSSKQFIRQALGFARTPPLEYLAAFVLKFIPEADKRKEIAHLIFGSYNRWLNFTANTEERKKLKALTHENAKTDQLFQRIRGISRDFSAGLKLLFFNRKRDDSAIANLSLDYVGF